MAFEDPFDFNPVSRITVGAVGQPGQRTFLLQASQGFRTISLKLEKQQVYALALGIDKVLEEMEEREVLLVSAAEEPPETALDLEEPIDPVMIVEQLGLGYDRSTNMMLLVAQELSLEGDAPPALVRFYATPAQMRALSRHAKDIVAHGRPLCPLCGEPMDPEGHFCPRGNGHTKATLVD
ncbi:MAG: DUF3090 domain-containing protein [Anaerolineae bacterium]